MVQLDYTENGRRRRFVFTGDLGRRNMGLLPDPTVVKDIDILVSESTYGNRELESYDRLIKQLHAIVARATRLQSKIVIPAFSLGRTQRMVYCLQELFALHKVRPIPVYVDSPLASRLTEIHRDHPEAYTEQARRLMDKDPMYFGSKYVEFCASWDDSRRLNYLPGPMVIIASSGMCEAGRIRHHLRHVVDDPDNAIVIVSYQAEGTLGRQIAEGVERIQILDQWHDLNAAVYVLDGFSGHADRNDLAWWFEQTGGKIEHAFLVHGEPESIEALAPVLQPHVSSPVRIPERHDPLRGLRPTVCSCPLGGGRAGFEAGGELADEPADLGDDLGAALVVAWASARRRTRALPTIRPSATGARVRTCSGELIPKPMQIGRSVCAAEPGNVLRQVGGQCLAFARDPGHRHVIDEPGRGSGDPTSPARGAWSA